LKIIFDARWLRSTKTDGIGNFTLNVLREIILLCREHYFFVLVNPGEVFLFLQKELSDLPNYRFFLVEYSVTSLQNIYSLPRLLANEKPDLYFSPNLPFFSFFLLFPQIAVVHDLIPLIFPELFRDASFKFRLFYGSRFFQRMAIKKLKKVLTVSENSKIDLISRLGLEKEKISVISEGYNQPELKANFQDLLSSRQIAGEYFLAVGRHERYKNLDGLISVYASLPEAVKEKYQLVIIGHFNERITPSLLKKTEELNLQSRIKFFAAVEAPELALFYANCKLFLHLSLYEGFGLILLEAMSFAKPVIAFACSSIPEVTATAALLAPVSDYRQVRENILNLLENEPLYLALSRKARSRALEFSWKKTAEQLRELFADEC